MNKDENKDELKEAIVEEKHCPCKSCSIDEDIKKILSKHGIENEKLFEDLESYVTETVVFFDDQALDNEMIVVSTRNELERLIKKIDRHSEEWGQYFMNKRKYRPVAKIPDDKWEVVVKGKVDVDFGDYLLINDKQITYLFEKYQGKNIEIAVREIKQKD